MSDLNLTQDEIQEITGKRRYKAQAHALRTIGIDFRTRPDGKLLISREHYLLAMGGIPAQNISKSTSPDFSSI